MVKLPVCRGAVSPVGLPAAAEVSDTPRGFSCGEDPWTPTPPPPPPADRPGCKHRVPPGAVTANGEKGFLTVGPPLETHSWPNNAEQRRAGCILVQSREEK